MRDVGRRGVPGRRRRHPRTCTGASVRPCLQEKNAASYRGAAMKTRGIGVRRGGSRQTSETARAGSLATSATGPIRIASIHRLRYFPPALDCPFSARTRFMSSLLLGRFAILLIVGLTGCGIVGPRRDSAVKGSPPTDRTKGALTELALAGSTRQPTLADPSTMIPPPPRMDLLPAIPSAPPKNDQFVSTAEE